MDRVVVTRPMVGLTMMQVCAVEDAPDEEILAVANAQNPAGTRAGWSEVIRVAGSKYSPDQEPVACHEFEGRKHFLVVC